MVERISIGRLVDVLLCILVLSFILISWSHKRAKDHLVSCEKNLEQLGLSLMMYANESRGEFYPALSTEAGRLFFSSAELYPEYMSDLALLTCPADKSTPKLSQSTGINVDTFFDDHSYWYLGARVTNELEGQNYIEAYRKRMQNPDLDNFIQETSATMKFQPDDPNAIYALSGIREHCFFPVNRPVYNATYSAKEVIVLIERPGHHKEGAHVLYMDGHVELILYPGKFPMTEEFITSLEGLDALGNISP